jgi:TonB family protein
MPLILLTAALAVAQDTWQVQRVVSPAKYPRLAYQAQIQGTAELRCTLANDGVVSNCRTVKGHPLLAQAAEENVKRWKFRSASHIASGSNEITLLYTFQLAGDPSRTEHDEFSFEFPNHATFVSTTGCSDRIPCTQEEAKKQKR